MSYPSYQRLQPPQQFLSNPHQHLHHIPQQQQQQPQQQAPPPQPSHLPPSSLTLPQQQVQQQPQSIQQSQPPIQQQQNPSQNSNQASSSSKPPYGAGGDDDGYTLVFANMDDFQRWREQEEIEKSVDFVKGDVHGSRAVPPRFKEHTKLVCARHTRSGRKKYIKKHPERQRKLPSRKLEGIGCGASISYKTYFDTEEVRACYNSVHSHEIGPANYPYTRRGRKAMATERGYASKKKNRDSTGPAGGGGGPGDAGGMDGGDDDGDGGVSDDGDQDADMDPGPGAPVGGPVGGQVAPQQAQPPQPQPQAPPPPQQQPQQQVAQQQQQQPPPHMNAVPPQYVQPPMYQNAYPQPIATSSRRPFQQAIPPPVVAAPPPPIPQAMPPPHDLLAADRWARWQRMSDMFDALKANGRNFDYPPASMAALEATLVRMTLESPFGGAAPGGGGEM
ncbi:hypothetical protein FRC03_003872 [Tulasnella sp. 419]|nr:hypothetical protein FRC03_003872 [Tulasnella sp. 419]